jgi:hypothetical protein
MWILKWLPFWIFYALFFIGLAGWLVTYLIKFIPISAIYVYKTPIQIISMILIVIGVYMSGAISNEEAWLNRVREMEVKVAEAEAKAAKENVKIVEKIVNKTQVVKQRGNDIVQYVDREVVKYDAECKIPKPFVEAHNKSAEQPK